MPPLLLSQCTTDYESIKFLFLIVILDNLGISSKRLWNLFYLMCGIASNVKKSICPSLNKLSQDFCCPLYSNQFDGSSKREHFEITKCDSLEATESSLQQREVMETTFVWYFVPKKVWVLPIGRQWVKKWFLKLVRRRGTYPSFAERWAKNVFFY